jgi:hypothetical protein
MLVLNIELSRVIELLSYLEPEVMKAVLSSETRLCMRSHHMTLA